MTDLIADIGDLVVLTHTITIDGVPTDPSSLVLDLQAPSGALTHAEYAGGAGLIAQDETGVYTFVAAPDEAGRWWYRWAASGTAQSAEEGSFQVRRRRVESSV
jgi:hypothetical protein